MKIHLLQNRKTKQFYWRAVARNGKTVADGAETYTSLAMAEKGLNSFIAAIVKSSYKIVKPEAEKPKVTAKKPEAKKPKARVTKKGDNVFLSLA